MDVRGNCFVKRNAPPSADRGLRFRDHKRDREDNTDDHVAKARPEVD